jgi:hypothetical protein
MSRQLDWAKAAQRDQIRSAKSLKPTDRQLSFLKSLCKRYGVEYIRPQTRADASVWIDGMLKMREGPSRSTR